MASDLSAQCENLILCAQNADKLNRAVKQLQKTSKAKITPISCDLSSVSGMDSLVSNLESMDLQIDLFIKNAGFGLSGYFVDNKWSDLSEMIHLNVLAVTKLSHCINFSIPRYRFSSCSLIQNDAPCYLITQTNWNEHCLPLLSFLGA